MNVISDTSITSPMKMEEAGLIYLLMVMAGLEMMMACLVSPYFGLTLIMGTFTILASTLLFVAHWAFCRERHVDIRRRNFGHRGFQLLLLVPLGITTAAIAILTMYMR